MDKRFAIFDMDGTLVDSMRYWQLLGREYLASKGVTDIPEEVLEKTKPMTMTPPPCVLRPSAFPVRRRR